MIQEVDRKVAIEVMGWRELTEQERDIIFRLAKTYLYWMTENNNLDNFLVAPDGSFMSIQPYSTDIGTAWKIVELLGRSNSWAIGWHSVYKQGEGWFVEDNGETRFLSLSGDACESAPLAICKAALKAKKERPNVQTKHD